MAKRGRPTSYTRALAEEICERLVNGESLAAICRSPGIPHVGTVLRWISTREEFRELYTHAREAQADLFASEIIDIADKVREGKLLTETEKDGKVESKVEYRDMTERAKIMIDARKWSAARIAPQKYGDKLDLNHSGAIGITITPDDAAL